MSVRSKIFRTMIRASGRKRTFASAENMRKFVARRRPAKESDPPNKLDTKFDIECTSVLNRPVYYLEPKERSSGRHIIYLHGGSYVQKMMRLHWNFIHRLTEAYPCSVSVPLYGLAPEFSHRDAFALLTSHYRDLLQAHAPEDIIIMGDSAGGGLALAFARSLVNSDLPQPGQVVMLSPWLDITLTNPAIPQVLDRDPLLDVPGNQEAGRMWAAGEDPRAPQLSPLYGPLEGLPPLCLFIGTDDILLPDARLFRDHASGEGHPLAYHEYPSMFHVWMLLPMPETERTITDIVQFISAEMGRRRPQVA